ncbi:MAG: diguanylate cyclase [Candidatus Eisenbacteria bacterium]|nr:diguanylate cyclase [Candidatus Eisenbacteria bacterium]
MRKSSTTARELLEHLISVDLLDAEGLRIYRSLLTADEEAARQGLAWLLDHLCELGYARRTARTVSNGAVRETYQNLTTLDSITLELPRADAAVPKQPPATDAPDRAPERPPDRGSEGVDVPGAASLPAEFLDAVAASSRRVDLAGSLSHLYDLLKRTVGYEHIAVFMSKGLVASTVGTSSELDDVFRWPPGARVTPEFLKTRVEESGRPVSIPDLGSDRRLQRFLPSDAHGSLVAAPLLAEGYVYGLLELWSEQPSAYGEDDVATIDFVARFAGGLIKRRLEVEELIFVDQASQIHNRRYFEEQITREMERCKRTGQAMALLMADLDGFKQVNDDLGHAAGDSILRQVARVLAENARQVDIVARYGGEEFAVILPNVSRDSAYAVAERIRRTVAEQQFVTGNESEPTRRVTVSIGGALYPLDAKSRADLLDKTDRIALYSAKRQGKNRVVFWDEVAQTED